MSWKDHIFAGAALLVWLALAIHTTCSISVTHDEIWHLPAGLRGWSGDFAADRLNPPVSRLWAALPVRCAGIIAERAANASELGHQFVAEHDDYLRWYVLGRLFQLAWPLATSLLLYYWTWRDFGLSSARFALLCFLCCPNVMAHGALVTPDAAAMCGFLTTSFLLTRWMAAPTWPNACLLGAANGLLQGIKFTGVVFGPVIVLAGVWLLWRGSSAKSSWRNRGAIAGQLVLALAVSLLVLAATYGFQGEGHRLEKFSFTSQALQNWQTRGNWFRNVPVPLPADYLRGMDEQLRIMESPHPIFLDGRWQLTGFPDYYLKALGYKLSHAFQLACLAGVWVAWRNRRSGKLERVLSLWGPLAILFAIASLSDMQLGLRYILPVIPALAMLAGRAAELLAEFTPAARRFLQAVMLLALLSPLRFHPHHLAYFNEYAGGPVGGRFHLVDSNLDWGQDLLRARDFIQAHADEQPRFVYFGMVDPRREGIAVPLPPSRRPEPGLYLISVNFVMGRPHVVWQPDGTHRAVDIHEFSYFRLFEPAARCGYSIDVYRITAEDIGRAINDAAAKRR